MHDILTDRVIIEVSGDDALKFLQNLTTNDLTASNYCYTYMLNNQGRYLFDFFVFKGSNQQFLIDIHKEHAESFKTKLMLYKLRADIKVNNFDNNCGVIYSRDKPKFLFIYSQIDPRLNKLGFRSLVKDVKISDYNLAKDLYLKDKYNYTIPDGYYDLIVDKSIPIEYGAEELGAISYNKGCYIGQEVISRAKYQGTIRKKLFKITADTDLDNYPKGTEIIVDNMNIGVFCSTYKNQAIALIRVDKNCDLQKPININNIKLELSVPHWRAREYETTNS